MDAMDSLAGSANTSIQRKQYKKKPAQPGQDKFSTGKTTSLSKVTLSTFRPSSSYDTTHPTRDKILASRKSKRTEVSPLPSEAQLRALREAKKLKDDRTLLLTSTLSGLRPILPDPTQAKEMLAKEQPASKKDEAMLLQQGFSPEAANDILKKMQTLQKELSEAQAPK
ncbi:hypothetical protein EOPP23_08970 [Endozoicomonas sp. OPT23]|uniref:hypothetical protein n=1 Tax=Endozoicomonas sp. OPT23 TaxID=2072845 RepID=UPI00129B9929|nr:hypothetical protein [Endozoicomonas sp. OPT23]MRI33113.1 hypothetical protein [Endozoicomonas sp. OPT23]